jgi:hypothetical protein
MWPVGEVLKRHVLDGLIDYAALQREQRLAFWINAYHALTLRTIIGHYPIRRYVPERDGYWHGFGFGFGIDSRFADLQADIPTYRARPTAA